MAKARLGAATFLYPMPITLVGAKVDERPNFMPVAYCGILQHSPPMISVSLGRMHFTNAGIKENGTFSVNIPSEEMVAVTDYCGIVTGRKVDKSSLFGIFYGSLKTAPMIKECPVNLECQLVQTLELAGSNEIFIGEIVETYADEDCLTNGLPDMEKVKPIAFSMHDNNYWKLGDHLARAWNVGKKLRSKKPASGVADE